MSTKSVRSAEEDDSEADRNFYLSGEPEADAEIDAFARSLEATGPAARAPRPSRQRFYDGDSDANRPTIVVRPNRPGFLSEVHWSSSHLLSGAKVSKTVDVVLDRSSDLAKSAERGSAAVRAWRESNERGKMRQKFWELGGTKMGALVSGEKKAVYMHDEDNAEESEKGASSTRQEAAAVASSRRNQDLPITHVLPDLIRAVRENEILIVSGETGSGKTTRLPPALWMDGSFAGCVACTQPRRVAAMSVAERVAQETETELGQEVGYTIRFEDKTSKATRVKYMTDGVLLRESLRDPELDRYAVVVMDEAHERSINTDVLFGVLKRVVRSRRDFRLVVTSATLNAAMFSSYFGGAAEFRIPGRTFKVEKYFAKTPASDYVDAAVKQIIQIHLSLPPGDILVFMTGQEDITATCELVAARLGEILAHDAKDETNQQLAKKKLLEAQLLILPMYSTLQSDLQARIFAPAQPGQRKCVVSTNVAETSLTVEGIRYVVDSGFTKMNVFNPRIGMDALRLIPISRAAAEQRAGRAGRTQEGFAYRLYTQTQFEEEMMGSPVPEIQRTSLAGVVLMLKSLGISNPLDFDFMDPPPAENLAESMHALWYLGALDDEGGLTPLGRRMVEFPLEPALAKMLLMAHEMECASEACTIVSMLSVPDVFFRPADRAQEADAAREKFIVPESDHLTLVNTYNQWLRHGAQSAWCNQHYLHVKSLRRAKEVRDQLEDVMRKQGLNPEQSSGASRWDAIRKCVCSSFFANSAKLKDVNGQYGNLLNGLPAYLHPGSALFGAGVSPEYVVFHELVLTSKQYMRHITAVEPEWLAELGPVFFELRRPGASSATSSHAHSANSAAATSRGDKNALAESTAKAAAKPTPARPRVALEDDDDEEEEDPLATARLKSAKRAKIMGSGVSF